MINKKKISSIVLLLAYLIVILVLIIIKHDMDSESSSLYWTCVFAYIVIWGMFVFRGITKKIDLFEPLTFITILYSIFFIFEPIIDLQNNDNLWFGENFIDVGPKATIIAIIGYIAFFVMYSVNNTQNLKKKNFKEVSSKKKKTFATSAIIMWCAGYGITMLFLLLTGKSITYILSAGLVGNGDLLDNRYSFAFVSMFSYTLIASWMIYFVYGKNKYVKMITFFLTISVYYLRGYRFIMIIFGLSPIIYSYIKKGKRPKVISLVIALFIGIYLIGFVAVARNNVRYGIGVSLDMFNFAKSWDQIKENFQIYNTYYALVKLIPSDRNYFFGQQIFLYTLMMFVPRLIWKNKPLTSPGLSVIADAITPYAATAGTAYPIIGEYYLEFGVVGVIIFMGIYGYWNKSLMKKYGNATSELSIITYVILMLSNFQIVIRGYTPSNFYMLVFFMIPIFIIKYIDKRIEE